MSNRNLILQIIRYRTFEIYHCLNKKQPSNIKDEVIGKILAEFILLRAKFYSLPVEEIEKIPKIKQIRETTIQITFQDFLDCLFRTNSTQACTEIYTFSRVES